MKIGTSDNDGIYGRVTDLLDAATISKMQAIVDDCPIDGWFGDTSKVRRIAPDEDRSRLRQVSLYTSPTRPADALVICGWFIQHITYKISEGLFRMQCDGGGLKNIILAVEPEIGIFHSPVVTEVREDGPDKDFMSDVRCVMDKNFVSIKFYTRFYAE